jgi:hypothetical protein
MLLILVATWKLQHVHAHHTTTVCKCPNSLSLHLWISGRSGLLESLYWLSFSNPPTTHTHTHTHNSVFLCLCVHVCFASDLTGVAGHAHNSEIYGPSATEDTQTFNYEPLQYFILSCLSLNIWWGKEFGYRAAGRSLTIKKKGFIPHHRRKGH